MKSGRVLTLGLSKTILASLLSVPFCVLLAAGAAPARAQPASGMCPAPIMTCGSPSADMTLPERACPDGYRCVCVPSCPDCDDCHAEVCVLDRVPECRTACDCDPGLGCFDGQCIAGFAPVYCCEQGPCPGGQQCQHRDGSMDVCGHACVGEVWECGLAAPLACGESRVCACTASCPLCEECGPPVCVPQATPTPWRCEADADCGPDYRCECVSSCEGCDDCPRSVCVPDGCEPDDKMCDERLAKMLRKTERLVRRTNRCESDEQCMRVDTSTGCQGACGEWISRMYVVPFDRRLDRIDRRVCGTYQDDGCPYATPGCIADRGACVRGRCRSSTE